MISSATPNAAEQAVLQQHSPALCRMLNHANSAAPADFLAELNRLTATNALTPELVQRVAVWFRHRRTAALLRRYRRAHPKRRIFNAAAFAEED